MQKWTQVATDAVFIRDNNLVVWYSDSALKLVFERRANPIGEPRRGDHLVPAAIYVAESAAQHNISVCLHYKCALP
jgi:hypothetical protein